MRIRSPCPTPFARRRSPCGCRPSGWPTACFSWEAPHTTAVAIELKDYVVVVEAPLDEERSLAVIEEVSRLFPNKPIRFLVNTHQHFDHIGGLRTYLHIGATIITHVKNYDFYNRDVLNLHAAYRSAGHGLAVAPDRAHQGLQHRSDSRQLRRDGRQPILNIYNVQPLQHAEGMLMAYLPAERMVIEADLFRYAHSAAREPDAGEPQPLQRGARAETGRLAGRADPGQAGPVVGVSESRRRQGHPVRIQIAISAILRWRMPQERSALREWRLRRSGSAREPRRRQC